MNGIYYLSALIYCDGILFAVIMSTANLEIAKG